jgi:2-polyprenyl-3-methyl-5-hydroxy-6-metoxy-1,4-benzoquinol methylase
MTSYQRYYQTGYYDHRYPVPNPATLRHIQAILRQSTGSDRRLLDYGCGSGRYCLPLSQENNLDIHVYDTCNEAISLLKQQLDEIDTIHTVKILNEEQIMESHTCYDIVLLLFGVLSHIPILEERQHLLQSLGHSLKPESGRLILSVPNKKRRFLQLQKRQGNGASDIQYQRQYQGQELHFFYHLYDRDELVGELQDAGFHIEDIVAESMFPESWLCH